MKYSNHITTLPKNGFSPLDFVFKIANYILYIETEINTKFDNDVKNLASLSI